MGRKCLSDEQVKINVNKKSKGRYEYIPDDKFPYKNQNSTILVKDSLDNSYKSLTYFYIMRASNYEQN